MCICDEVSVCACVCVREVLSVGYQFEFVKCWRVCVCACVRVCACVCGSGVLSDGY